MTSSAKYELWAVLGLIALVYLSPALRLPARGEEPRWALAATEMRRGGDWLVPHQQGTPIAGRPPLHAWTVAVAQELTGSDAAWALRLPSVLAVLLVCALLAAYTRGVAAPVIFATLGEMMQIGSSADSDATGVLLVSSSLLLWHLWHQRSRPLAAWTAGYALVALAVLCKGGALPPLFFLGPIALYLIALGQHRALFTWSHLAGVAVGAALVAVWLVPAVRTHGWDAVIPPTPRSGLTSFAVFPLEAAGSTLPWLPLAALLALPAVRANLGEMSRPALFCAIASGFAFPVVWLSPGGETQHLAPLYPCLAVVLAAALEAAARAGVAWQSFARLGGLAAGVCAAAVIGLSLGRARPLAEPLFGAGLIGGGLLAAAWALARTDAVRPTILAIAAAAALVNAVWLTGVRARRSPAVAPAVAAVRERLGPDARLVSFDLLPPAFAYHFGAPIAYVGRPRDRDQLMRTDVFALTATGPRPPSLPGSWDEIARVPVERAGGRWVLIGRPARAEAAVRVSPSPAGSGAAAASRSSR